jgi:hypothetical protein
MIRLVLALVGPVIGFIVGQRLIGADCQLSPTAAADITSAIGRMGDVAHQVVAAIPPLTLPSLPTPGGLKTLMPTDSLTWLLWLLAVGAALGALAAWRWRRRSPTPSTPDEAEITEAPREPQRAADSEWGREFKKGIGSAGIKSIVREARMEEAYQVRTGSDTAFEAYADFDEQQERVALNNRLPGPAFLALSDTLQARSPLGEGMGNRPPAEVWAMREEWMPSVGHFVEEAAFSLRAAGIWPARITAHLSAGGHGLPGLFALFATAREFPRADRHAHFIVPEGDVERHESIRLLEAMRFGELNAGTHTQPLPWIDHRPLALTTVIRDNRQGRDDLDEVSAHIAPALSARVRFETGTSENLSNLMRRLTKHGVHAELEPCPLTLHYAGLAVPVARDGARAVVDVSTVLPLADAALRALRHGDGVTRALDVDMGRHLLLVTVPCNAWDEVRQVEEYVTERLEFAGPPDRQCIGVFFSGYRPATTSREERVLAIRLGAVSGGWDAVYRAIFGSHTVAHATTHGRANGVVHDGSVAPADGAAAHEVEGPA